MATLSSHDLSQILQSALTLLFHSTILSRTLSHSIHSSVSPQPHLLLLLFKPLFSLLRRLPVSQLGSLCPALSSLQNLLSLAVIQIKSFFCSPSKVLYFTRRKMKDLKIAHKNMFLLLHSLPSSSLSFHSCCSYCTTPLAAP